MNSKRGQITVFIIIGLIILFSTAIFFYFKQAKVEEEVGAGAKVPYEIQPVETYVTDCIETIAQEAVLKVGRTGGYLTFGMFLE